MVVQVKCVGAQIKRTHVIYSEAVHKDVDAEYLSPRQWPLHPIPSSGQKLLDLSVLLLRTARRQKQLHQ